MTYEDLSYALIMLKRKLILLVSVLILGFVGSFPFTSRVINNIIETILPEGASVIYLTPVEVMLLKFKMALIAGVLFTIPFIVYYVYFALKGRLNISISRFSIATIGMSALILFLLGVGYAYFLMLPFFINYLFRIGASAGVVATYSISQFISFITLISVIFGLVFEFPLIIIILVLTGIVERNTLVKYRYHTYIGLLVLAALITPPDVISQIIIAAPLILFFEFSMLLVRFVGRPGK